MSKLLLVRDVGRLNSDLTKCVWAYGLLLAVRSL